MFCILKSIGFEIDLDRCVNYMKQHLNDGSQLFQWPGEEYMLYSHYSEFDGFNLFKKYMEELRAVSGPDPMETDVKSILQKKVGWGKELKDYAIDKFTSDGMSYSKVIGYASAKEWSDLLLNAESEDIHYFRLLATGRSNLEEKEAEILREILQNVQNKLDQNPPDSKIVTMQLRWLVENIEEKMGQSENK